MIKSIGRSAFLALLGAVIMSAPLSSVAADDTNKVTSVKTPKRAKTAKNTTTAAKSSSTFSGKLFAVDKVAKTVTVEDKTTNRVFLVTSQTKIFKGTKGTEKPATLEEGTLGESVTGSWSKDEEGKQALKTLYFRGLKETKATDAKPTATTKKKKKSAKSTTPPATNAVAPDAVLPPK